MSTQKVNVRTIVLVLMIVVAAAMRLVTYKIAQIDPTYAMWMANFTPLGAIALFGGAYFTDKWKAFLIVFVAIFLSNMSINYLYTGKVMLFGSNDIVMYIVFGLMALIGTFIKKVNIVSVGFASLISVCIHWLIMDLPFLYGTVYPHTLAGYGQSLVAAIPFERNMVLADILFCGLLFGVFELAKNKYTILRTHKELAV